MIKIENYTQKIKKDIILNDINLHLKENKIYGFVGRNGSGKSILFKGICGLLNISNGKIIIKGKEIGKDIDFYDNLGAVLDGAGFLPNLSSFDNLKLLASIRNKISDSDIKSALNKVGLDPNDKKKYKKYSLGMKQKLGIAQAIMEKPDLIILDIMLPKLNGNDVLQRLRKFTNAPVIVVSAKTMVQTKIDLLKLGADDYMTKPFDLHELLARIEANLKRTSNTSCQNDTLTYRDIEINNSLVYIKEVLVSFTSTELKILRLLLQYPQKIFSKQNLYESIWNKTYAYDDDTINTHISHIRKKIKAITNEDYIQTIWGIGYKIK